MNFHYRKCIGAYGKCIGQFLNWIFQDDATIACKFDVHYNFKARQDLQYCIKILFGCNGPNVPQSEFNICFHCIMYGSVYFWKLVTIKHMR